MKPTHCLQFLQRTKVLGLYRTIIRGVYRISDPTTRAESRDFAREQFERHRNVTDIVRLTLLTKTTNTDRRVSLLGPHTLSFVHGQDGVGEHGEVYRGHVGSRSNCTSTGELFAVANHPNIHSKSIAPGFTA